MWGHGNVHRNGNVSKSRAGFYKGRNKKEEKKYVLSGSFNLTDTPEESPMYGTFSIEEN